MKALEPVKSRNIVNEVYEVMDFTDCDFNMLKQLKEGDEINLEDIQMNYQHTDFE